MMDMAQLRLPGQTAADRAQVLIQAVEEALTNVTQTLNQNGLTTATSTLTNTLNSILTSLENLLASLTSSLSNTSSRPTTVTGVLQKLLDQRVTITTPFDTLTGTLSSIQSDYATLVEPSGSLVLIPLDRIQSVQQA
ncbi:heat-inducible transcription repressor HrcA [Alicyclobacillus hesperidum URH17-3-68]|nr:heat-inducible transcription repressor HrcA [Alicyclobacillus hesperidum URH17-3-68]